MSTQEDATYIEDSQMAVKRMSKSTQIEEIFKQIDNMEKENHKKELKVLEYAT